MNNKKLAVVTAERVSAKRVSATTGVLLGISAVVGTVFWLIYIIGRQ